MSALGYHQMKQQAQLSSRLFSTVMSRNYQHSVSRCREQKFVSFLQNKVSGKSFPNVSINLAAVWPTGNVYVRTLVTGPREPGEETMNVISSDLMTTPEALPVNMLEQIETVQQSGKVAVLFSDSPLVISTVDFLYVLKDLPGMTWVGTIIFGTLLIRTLVGLPVSITQQKSLDRLEKLKPQFETLAKELKQETAFAIKRFGWNEKTARKRYMKSYKKHWRKIVEENKCHPMRSLALSLIQLPFWICFSSALRNVVYAVPLPRTSEQMERWAQIYAESTPWLESLVLPDPVVLPVIFLGVNLLNIEYTRRKRLPGSVSAESKLQKVVPWILRGGIVFIAYIATSVPSAVSMYWATSSSMAFAQNLFLSSKMGRNLFGFKSPSMQLKTNQFSQFSSGNLGQTKNKSV